MIPKLAFVPVIAGAMILSIDYAASQVGAAPGVPEKLNAPVGQILALEVQATGVQIYECAPTRADPAKFDWSFKAPEAVLFDSDGRRIGKHYAGPTWESDDGSKVAGEVVARDDGPDPNAIPWLLLKAKSVAGNGVFGKIERVQRLQTVGGKAPDQGCARENVGAEARVEYKAAYFFYASRS